MKGNLPDFFVVGAPKTGTTSLYSWLSRTKGFYLPSVKEPHFLVYNKAQYINSMYIELLEDQGYVLSERSYRQLYSKKGERISGDFSTHYFYHTEKFIESLVSLYGNGAKSVPIFVILRDPVERAISHYKMKVRDRQEGLKLEEAISERIIQSRISKGYVNTFDYLGFSSYKRSYELLSSFSNNFHVLDFNHFHRSPELITTTISKVLGVPYIQADTTKVKNASGERSESWFGGLAYDVLYGDNVLKRLLPRSVKHKLSGLKDSFASVALDDINVEEGAIIKIADLLCKETEFYRSVIGDKR